MAASAGANTAGSPTITGTSRPSGIGHQHARARSDVGLQLLTQLAQCPLLVRRQRDNLGKAARMTMATHLALVPQWAQPLIPAWGE